MDPGVLGSTVVVKKVSHELPVQKYLNALQKFAYETGWPPPARGDCRNSYVIKLTRVHSSKKQASFRAAEPLVHVPGTQVPGGTRVLGCQEIQAWPHHVTFPGRNSYWVSIHLIAEIEQCDRTVHVYPVPGCMNNTTL
eukprot:837066-Rhodomonas_salina.1